MLLAVLFCAVRAGIAVDMDAGHGKAPGKEKHINPDREKGKEPVRGEDRPVDNLLPQNENGPSMTAAVAMDLAVPGGGHFYLENYYTGAVFASLKVIGAFSVYYYYRDWKLRKSLYQAARRANELIDPTHDLEFHDPGGGYKTVAEFKRDYDRAAQHITLSFIGTAAVYIVSLVMTCNNIIKINEKTVPTFDYQYSCDTMLNRPEGIFRVRYTFRM
jgi:hypothetical protein